MLCAQIECLHCAPLKHPKRHSSSASRQKHKHKHTHSKTYQAPPGREPQLLLNFGGGRSRGGAQLNHHRAKEGAPQSVAGRSAGRFLSAP